MYTTTSLNTTANVMRFQVGELVRGHTYDVEIWVTNGGGSSLHRKLCKYVRLFTWNYNLYSIL